MATPDQSSITMADITNVLNAIWPVLIISSLSFIENATADYCEFGLCESEQYCCGDNKCCTKTLDLWFFWAGILLVIFALAVAAGVRYTRNRHGPYVFLPTHPPEEAQVSQVSFK